jgi:hypothetical protein
MGLEQTMDAVARGVEILRIVTLVLGLAAALVRAGLVLTGGQDVEEAYRIVRDGLRTQHPVGAGISWSRPNHKDGGRPAVAAERGGPGAVRVDPDIPELLVGGGD